MLPEAHDYAVLRDAFRWRVPETYNIGVDVCDRWAGAEPHRLALIHLAADGAVREYRFGELRRLANRVANLFRHHGIGRGQRVGILLAQAPETALAHLAVYRMGAVAVPLFSLFGSDALAYRLGNCGATAVVTDNAGLEKLSAIREALPKLATVFNIDGAGDGAVDFHAELARASDVFTPVVTRAEDPALIIYTSGTTGQPKGALHAHRVLLGHLPGVEMSHDFLGAPGDCLWTPADWAWIGGLLDVLMPAWHHGIPVVAHRFGKFDPQAALALMARFGVRNTFLPPTALKLMRAVENPPPGLRLRSVASGGESLGETLLHWGRRVLGVTINEFYGQTECNMIVSSSARLGLTRPGRMGRAVPGHDLAIIDDAGQPVAAGVQGHIAVRRPDPVMFLEYWDNPDATRAKFIQDWLVTGDVGEMDDDGYIRFVGRDDDVITSGGYRIGPGEIEDCLITHPAVRMAAAVGMPDELRTEIVRAYVVLESGWAGDEALKTQIQRHVRERLAAHEYPREVVFIDELPMTTTGKVMRRVLRERGR